jgi:chromosome segregation ATPase
LEKKLKAGSQKFLGEKRRLDDLDADIKKLMSLNSTVEARLADMTETNDSLQTIQMKVRELEGFGHRVEGLYERLEKKQDLLESTSSGVDKNFELLDEMDKQFSEFQKEFNLLPSEIRQLDEKVSVLAKSKKDADKAIKQLDQLDRSMTQVEARAEKLEVVRDWLARTETRFEEVNREAQEQVKLLGAILKEGNKVNKKQTEPVDIRSMVKRLAHQGWTILEISQATKLSRGEVELILELMPKK